MSFNAKVKLALAAGFLLCLLDMPYWYYQMVRLLGTIGLAYLSWDDFKRGQKPYALFYGIAAVLLNPVIKIAFGRTIWNFIDVVLAVFLLVDVFIVRKRR